MGWEGGGRPGVGELDPAATAATLSPGGVMITTPAGPGRAEQSAPRPLFPLVVRAFCVYILFI